MSNPLTPFLNSLFLQNVHHSLSRPRLESTRPKSWTWELVVCNLYRKPNFRIEEVKDRHTRTRSTNWRDWKSNEWTLHPHQELQQPSDPVSFPTFPGTPNCPYQEYRVAPSPKFLETSTNVLLGTFGRSRLCSTGPKNRFPYLRSFSLCFRGTVVEPRDPLRSTLLHSRCFSLYSWERTFTPSVGQQVVLNETYSVPTF